MHRIIAALLVATSCVATAQAQDTIAVAPRPTEPVLTLDRAVELGGRNGSMYFNFMCRLFY